MDTWTRRIEGNLFFFFSFSHWISYLECMYTQNPAASISIYNNPKEKKKKKKKKKKKSSYTVISLSSRFGYYIS